LITCRMGFPISPEGFVPWAGRGPGGHTYAPAWLRDMTWSALCPTYPMHGRNGRRRRFWAAAARRRTPVASRPARPDWAGNGCDLDAAPIGVRSPDSSPQGECKHNPHIPLSSEPRLLAATLQPPRAPRDPHGPGTVAILTQRQSAQLAQSPPTRGDRAAVKITHTFCSMPSGLASPHPERSCAAEQVGQAYESQAPHRGTIACLPSAHLTPCPALQRSRSSCTRPSTSE
jgi:hypothetical protein